VEDVVLESGPTVRIGPWRGHIDVAHLMTFAEQPLARAGVADITRRLQERGYRTIVTGALLGSQQTPFFEESYVVHRSLALLQHDLADIPDPGQGRPNTRRSWQLERPNLLRIDADAFDDFWTFDDAAFIDAIRATPTSRLRVAGGRTPVAYAISGVAGRTGYLQRVAVSPRSQGQGHGRSLTLDALRWMARRGALRGLVNTQVDNINALGLYERVGFVRSDEPMAVLRFGPAM
jgi:GNAT superfamily N-acetyltransferase